ncbi:MAG: lysophospholipid acyltransferase family protein [Thermoanaerobacterales bacterium]|nr:lysophospholipid acyltransferase family protein [Bacillota bacterium]MDI6906306.1 lysophospholipid acyltransferase family protein [Thermoanaerobacterales bacterium]
MFYWFARWLCKIALVTLRRWEVRGVENIPAEGPLIVTANHVSYWDPVVVGCALSRQVFFMAKAELFRFPVFASILRWLGAFPVHRHRPDRQALQRTRQELEKGHVLGVFPEGTRSKTDTFLKPHLGAALLAVKYGVPVLPVALQGTRGLCGKVRVRIGEPLRFAGEGGEKPSKERLEAVAQEIMERIGALLKGLR